MLACFLTYYKLATMKNYNYKFSIWLFDKDLKRQVISNARAQSIVKDLTINHFGYWSITAWEGLYTHEDWSKVEEPSLFVNVSFEKELEKSVLLEYVNVLKFRLNQESIMISKTVEDVDFL